MKSLSHDSSRNPTYQGPSQRYKPHMQEARMKAFTKNALHRQQQAQAFKDKKTQEVQDAVISAPEKEKYMEKFYAPKKGRDVKITPVESNKYPPGYGARIGAPPGSIFTMDFQDYDADGIDDRYQSGPGQSRAEYGGPPQDFNPGVPPNGGGDIKFPTARIPQGPGTINDPNRISGDYLIPPPRDWSPKRRSRPPSTETMPKWKKDPNQASGREYDVNPIQPWSPQKETRYPPFDDIYAEAYTQPKANPRGIGNVGRSSSNYFNDRLNNIQSKLTSEYGFEMPGNKERPHDYDDIANPRWGPINGGPVVY